MKCAAKPHWAVAQLVAAAAHELRQAGLWFAFGQCHGLFAETRKAIAVGEEGDFVENGHAFTLSCTQPAATCLHWKCPREAMVFMALMHAFPYDNLFG